MTDTEHRAGSLRQQSYLFSKILIQTTQDPKLLYSAKITEKFKSLCSVQRRFKQLTTDDRHRQTDVLCHTANVTK